jgi:hypothetical protein
VKRRALKAWGEALGVVQKEARLDFGVVAVRRAAFLAAPREQPPQTADRKLEEYKEIRAPLQEQQNSHEEVAYERVPFVVKGVLPVGVKAQAPGPRAHFIEEDRSRGFGDVHKHNHVALGWRTLRVKQQRLR